MTQLNGLRQALGDAMITQCSPYVPFEGPLCREFWAFPRNSRGTAMAGQPEAGLAGHRLQL